MDKAVAEIKCWWFCLWRPRYSVTRTYNRRGKMVALTATDADYRIVREFWVEE